MPQTDLDGNPITQEEIITKKIIHYGNRFCITVTEPGELELIRLKDDHIDTGSWIAKHMRLNEPLPVGEEGECFKTDLEKFKEKFTKQYFS